MDKDFQDQNHFGEHTMNFFNNATENNDKRSIGLGIEETKQSFLNALRERRNSAMTGIFTDDAMT